MSVNLSTGLRQNMLQATGFQTSFAHGVIYVYSGPQPLTADSPVQGTLLGKVTVNAGAFSFGSNTNGITFDNPVAGTISKAAAETWQMIGIANGTAGWARLMGNATDALGTSTTLPRLDMAIANIGGDLNLSSVNIVTGAPTTIDVFQFTLPAN